jgi:hypothetical protein
MTVTIALLANSYYNGTKTLDGNAYYLRFHWNTYTAKWYMDLQGLNNDVDIKGMALLTGKNLLNAYGEYELGELWVVDNQGANEDPNFDDIGSRWTLEYTPLEE